MAYTAHLRVWRGDATKGEFVNYDVEAERDQVVLDVIHNLQATQAGDLAVRWNCKAGKCGSCSAEINGKPRLLCMTQMAHFGEDELITISPMRAFPIIRDLVTDVSYNYVKAKEVPELELVPRPADGVYRMAQEDIERIQEFHKCIECFMCQNVCHVIRDHEENKPAFAGPRILLKYAELDMHPLAAKGAYEVLQRGLPRGHPHHRQRDHPAQGARRRPVLRPADVAGLEDRLAQAGPALAAVRQCSTGSPHRSRWPACSPAAPTRRAARRRLRRRLLRQR